MAQPNEPHFGFLARRRTPSSRPYSGVQLVGRETYRDWDLAIERRELGSTIKRVQYSVRIANAPSDQAEQLNGFSTVQLARQAACRRVDFIIDIQLPHRPIRRPRKRRYWKY